MTQQLALSFDATPVPDSGWDNLLPFFESPCKPPEEWTRAVDEHLQQGGERLREALSGAPFWAKRAAQARAAGGEAGEKEFWEALSATMPNLYSPMPKIASSTPAPKEA